MSNNAYPKELELFHTILREWFLGSFSEATEIQRLAWPAIASGEHVLITSPTGSGKTLTAFFSALNRLITGEWMNGSTRILYVSPLKALNNDIQRNLVTPLNELKDLFSKRDRPFPEISVQTRSGDTTGSQRQRMLRHPPEILITTPESLNLLLSSHGGRSILGNLSCVILDEIHAVAGTKRGSHLITAVDRLVRLSGEFQRIGLSATIRPLDGIAAFLGGYRYSGGTSGAYEKRNVRILRSSEKKSLQVRICSLEGTIGAPTDGVSPGDNTIWHRLVPEFSGIIQENRSTLFFANSRRATEKTARLINETAGETVAYSHHGSLSRELRYIVEKKLKMGELSAIIATNSLELGIDIGSLDEVILIETPPSVVSAVQRIGRSGHSVGQTSRARLFPIHSRDILNAFVMTSLIEQENIEETHPVVCPLDVLAQILVSMLGIERWNVDELYAFVRTSFPFQTLKRRSFDIVMEMLAGRYSDAPVRALKGRISIDRLEGTAEGKRGILSLVYLSGGTIPDRGYFTLRIPGPDAVLGELDEEFVWERSVGDRFHFGARAWRIQRIGDRFVDVHPEESTSGMAPFWKAERRSRDFHFAEKVAEFLEVLNERLATGASVDELLVTHPTEAMAAKNLVKFLRRQREATKSDLPHRHHLLVECCAGSAGESDYRQILLHTLWGGRINRPFALALSEAWENRYGYPLEIYHDDDAIMILLPHRFDPEELFSLVPPNNLENLLRKKLEKTDFFGARFRECASNALLLPRKGYHHRTPLWLTRLRSKKLLVTTLGYRDFPIILETWRSIFQSDIDLPHLMMLLDEVECGKIKLTVTNTAAPSPFASGLVWRQTNKYVYDDDTPTTQKTSRLDDDLIREAVHDDKLRPELPEELIAGFSAKIQRTAPGYSPASARDLLDWVKERLLLPEAEWNDLLLRIEDDHGMSPKAMAAELSEKLVWVRLPGAKCLCLMAVENVNRLCRGFVVQPGVVVVGTLLEPESGMPEKILLAVRKLTGSVGLEEEPPSVEQLVGEWLRFYGPVPVEELSRIFGLDTQKSTAVVTNLGSGVAEGRITENLNIDEICDSENLESLLRIFRRGRRPVFQPLGPGRLCQFIADWQGLSHNGRSADMLEQSLERLFGYPLNAGLWEKEVFPARNIEYRQDDLDRLLDRSSLIWMGLPRKKILFCFEHEVDLFTDGERQGADSLPLPEDGRYGFWELQDKTDEPPGELINTIWNLVWKGIISNDGFTAVRRGISGRSNNPAIVSRPGPGKRRFGFNGWNANRSLDGRWFRIRYSPPNDSLEEEELFKDRIHQLLERYGVLFRELLIHELRHLGWSRIFRTLRLMELSGDLLSGQFFQGCSTPQFISHTAFEKLRRKWPDDRIYWMSAADPASLCGILKNSLPLPRRLATTHLVFQGPRVVFISRKSGAELEFLTEPEDLHTFDYPAFFRVLLSRSYQPFKSVRVRSINGVSVEESPFTPGLLKFGFIQEYRCLILRREPI